MELPEEKNISILAWLSRNYGKKGFKNYSEHRVNGVIYGLMSLLDGAEAEEIEFIGNFLLELLKKPELIDTLLDEISDCYPCYEYYGDE